MSFENIPQELRQLNQWVCWRYVEIHENGKTRKTKEPLRATDGRLASVTDPRDWNSHEYACNASKHCDGIGFVFTLGDLYCGVDLDNTNCADGNSIQDQANLIYEKLNSYAETSPSGNGLHIICKARLPGNGRRRGGVEIYDNARFFTFTGNTVNNLLPQERQTEIVELWQSLGSNVEITEIPNGSEKETRTDEEILNCASSAANGEKFSRLYGGEWTRDYGDKSQSEADFALINILAFYSRNTAQIIRLFRNSELGKRPKAQRGTYVGLMVRRAFDRMPRLVEIGATPGQAWFDATAYEPWEVRQVPLAAMGTYTPPAIMLAPVRLPEPPPGTLPPIPGLVGKLMLHCWHASTYPVAEVSIASALSTMALLTSRSYRFGSRGLCLYVLLLAKTSIGKSFAYQAQQAIRTQLSKQFDNPTGGQHYKARQEYLRGMIIGKIGSGPGLAQHMVKHPSTLSQFDEFVKVIKRIAHPHASTNDLAIQEEFLSLTDAGKPGAIYVEKAYSERGGKSKADPVSMACFNVLGTGTPGEFYDDINNGILEGGFLPRFLILDYEGTLPQKNHNEIHAIDQNMMYEVTHLFNRMFELSRETRINIEQLINVEIEPDAAAEIYSWERYCEDQVRFSHSTNAPTSGLWSRATMHVNQIAALIAIGVNAHKPVITLDYVKLALGIKYPSLEKLCGKIDRGEIGMDDNRGEAEIKKFVKRIQSEGFDFCKQFPTLNKQAIEASLIQTSLIRWYVGKRAPFKEHRLGTNMSFEHALAAIVKAGDLELVHVKSANGRTFPCVAVRF